MSWMGSLGKKFTVAAIIAFLLIAPFSYAKAANETQDQLEQELRDVQQQIDQYTAELAKTQTQKTTLANKIKQLQTRQKALTLQIKQTALQLKKINGQIIVTESSIDVNLKKQKALKSSMSAILREMSLINHDAIFQLLSSKSLSEVYDRIYAFSSLTAELDSMMGQNKKITAELNEKQVFLSDKKTETGNLLKISSIQNQSLAESLTEQNSLLLTTKGLESNYQAVLADKKKRAAEIRNQIYELFNTGKQIDFGQAVDIAKTVSNLTGMRPAFLLAILTQESNLGKNVGTCNRAGDPPEKSWKVIMKPDRDQNPFIKITDDLGLKIDITPVSCPMHDKKGKQVGWGGAMGPAQFIPSTWMGYKDKVAALTGKSYANPWDIRDAFTASAIKLKSDGADGTDDGDWQAAMKYFAGSVNLKFRFYGDNVLATTKKYQAEIDQL